MWGKRSGVLLLGAVLSGPAAAAAQVAPASDAGSADAADAGPPTDAGVAQKDADATEGPADAGSGALPEAPVDAAAASAPDAGTVEPEPTVPVPAGDPARPVATSTPQTPPAPPGVTGAAPMGATPDAEGTKARDETSAPAAPVPAPKASPDARAGPSQAVAVPAEPPAPVEPRLAIGLALGMAFGGDPPLGARAPNGGEGVVLAAAAAFTPLWTGGLGFGVGLELGYKYTAHQSLGGSYELRRFPFTATLHALLPIGGAWYAVLAGGAHAEIGVHWWRSGSLSNGDEADIPASLGFLGEAGVRTLVGRVGVGISVRYTGLSYEMQDSDGTTDASSVALMLDLRYAVM